MNLDFNDKKKNTVFALLIALVILLCMDTIQEDFVIGMKFSFAKMNDIVSQYDNWVGIEGIQQQLVATFVRFISLLPVFAGVAAGLFFFEKKKYFYPVSMLVAIIVLCTTVLLFSVGKLNAEVKDYVKFTIPFWCIPIVCILIIKESKDQFLKSEVDEIKHEIEQVAGKVKGNFVVSDDNNSIYKLTMVKGDMQGMKLTLTSEHIIVGRDVASAHIVLSNTTISRKHCEFFVENENCYVVDYSKTGTFVNGIKRVDFGTKYKLIKNDTILLGDESQVFRID